MNSHHNTSVSTQNPYIYIYAYIHRYKREMYESEKKNREMAILKENANLPFATADFLLAIIMQYAL